MRAVLLAVLVIGFALPAAAGDYCHQGYKECDTTTTTTADTTTSSLDTTTTTPNETTTTSSLPDDTTTTSSTLPATTSTVPSSSPTTSQPLVTEWAANSHCDELTATWGEGIVQVDVWLQGGIPGTDIAEVQGDSLTTSGQVMPTGIAGVWILVPVTVAGYTAEPDQIELTTERCETTTVPTTTPPSSSPASTLPFTGPFENVTALSMSAVALIVLGWLLLKEARR